MSWLMEVFEINGSPGNLLLVHTKPDESWIYGPNEPVDELCYVINGHYDAEIREGKLYMPGRDLVREITKRTPAFPTFKPRPEVAEEYGYGGTWCGDYAAVLKEYTLQQAEGG